MTIAIWNWQIVRGAVTRYIVIATRKFWQLNTKNVEVVVKHTEKGGDAAAFAKQAAEDHYDSVFVMGGDGTVNEGISSLAELDYRPTFGFFPLGTVNDLARALGIPFSRPTC